MSKKNKTNNTSDTITNSVLSSVAVHQHWLVV